MAKPPYKKYTFRLTSSQAKKVKRLAKLWEVSESEIIRQAIESVAESRKREWVGNYNVC